MFHILLGSQVRLTELDVALIANPVEQVTLALVGKFTLLVLTVAFVVFKLGQEIATSITIYMSLYSA